MKQSIWVLTAAPFAFATSTFVHAGLLEPMAGELGVSLAAAGQLQTAFAAASAIGGPVLAGLTAGLDRKRLLIGLLLVLAVTNALAALASGFGPLVAARLAGGGLGALILPVASMLAVSGVRPEQRPAAITLAFLIGVPLGSLVGAEFGWRAAFGFAGAVAVAAAVGVALLADGGVGGAAAPKGAFRAALTEPGWRLMSLTLLSFTAIFAAIAYVGPIVTRLTGATGGAVGGFQALIGVGSLVGLVLGARLATRPLAAVTAGLFVVIALAQALLGLGVALRPGPTAGLLITVVGIAVGAAALFALMPIVQSRLAATAGSAATVAFALNGSMVFAGQALGAALGGWVIALGGGLAGAGLAGAAVAVAGVTAALSLRPGARVA